ncbi:MAG: hypothetical protein IJ800_00360 [Clostridia bacterium]|nr:hypothetical protein [Clostridia bacterium]
MKKNTVKKLFVEVSVDVMVFDDENVLTTSGPMGAYGELEKWGGLYDIW